MEGDLRIAAGLAPFDAPTLVGLRRVTAIAIAPSGDWAAASVQRLDADGASYVSDLWRVPLDGGAAVQLTRGDASDGSPCFRSDGALGFLSNRPPHGEKADD